MENNLNIEPQKPDMAASSNPKKSNLKLALIVLLIFLLSSAAFFMLRPDKKSADQKTATANLSSQVQPETETTKVEGLELDPSKNYGDKYADGILPVGDEQFTTSTPSEGKVYVCNDNFVPDSQAGAQTRGPWFVGTTQWDINKKYAVQGNVDWDESLTNKLSNGQRIISTNDLPDHETGTFPVGSSDPAAKYDRNPNTIKSQALTYTLSGNPTYGEPQCMGGEVGVMLTGVALFNAFDAGGRDAGAWEIQDACEGHPQGSGVYHYHTLSSCIKDMSVKAVIGFALDGFPITGPKVGDENYLTTSDLDECHGINSEIELDGKKTTMYHYVMTQDFPYSASCFRSTAAQSPAQHAGSQQPPRP